MIEHMPEFLDSRPVMKTCKGCGLDLPRSKFSADARKKDGKRPSCKDCSRVARRAWDEAHKDRTANRTTVRRNKLKAIVQQHKSNPCVDCGKSFHFSLMHYDHVEGDKVNSVSNVLTMTLSIEKTMAEIAKCDLVCCLCHGIRTWNRANPEDQISYL